ncbi:hypothetical protein IHE61_30965 [Streptomyces sp. GKU 257-1]|nr:hypothetical protein [Streptomyces sp. GKU 257-1]
MTAVTTAANGPVRPVQFTEPEAGRVMTPAGYSIDADTAQRVAAATPDNNTDRGRTSRAGLFAEWCRKHGRDGAEPGTVPDYCAHLARLRHPAATIEAYATTLANLLAVNGRPLCEQDRAFVRAIIASRSAEEASDPANEGDALQSPECTREDLRAMVATLDRSTVRGTRDARARCCWTGTPRAARASPVP